jgi:hypothetical protein
MTVLSRRHAVAGLALVPLLPRAAAAAAAAVNPLLAESLEKLGVKSGALDWNGPIRLSAPLIADDGSAVPVTASVESGQAVRQIHLFAPANRRALVASVTPLGQAARAEFQIRIRLAKSQSVIAVARLEDGRAIAAAAEVRVTAGGGCKP